MKSIFILALLTVTHSMSFAAQANQVRTLQCRNEAHSAVTASLTMNENVMKLKFGRGSDSGSLEDGIKSKSVQLRKDLAASTNGYVQYVGDVLTIPAWKEYRTVEVRIKSSLLAGTSPFHVSFAFSNEHQKNDQGYVFTSYGMICK